MRNILILGLTLLALGITLQSCKKVNKVEESTQNNRGNPPAPPPSVDCDDIGLGVFIQGKDVKKVIYFYNIGSEEMPNLKPFPNWYSYYKYIQEYSGTPPQLFSVEDACISELLAKVDAGDAIMDTAYPNRARIRIHFNINDSGYAYVNGSSVNSGSSRSLDTGNYIYPLTSGKNVVALKSNNSAGFGGAIAHVKVNDCGEIGGDGKCDGTGYDFYSSKATSINYTIPPEITGCFPLYTVDFNAISHWGLSKSYVTSWTTGDSMSGFSSVPEGYEQSNSEVGTGTLSGYPDAKWLSSGVDHPYCGPEGYDWGIYPEEDGELYYKTIITCDYYWCWQDSSDTVVGTLFVP